MIGHLLGATGAFASLGAIRMYGDYSAPFVTNRPNARLLSMRTQAEERRLGYEIDHTFLVGTRHCGDESSTVSFRRIRVGQATRHPLDDRMKSRLRSWLHWGFRILTGGSTA